MYSAVLIVHSWLRWVVIVAGLYAAARGLLGGSRHASWTPADDRAGFWFVMFLDLQLTIGLVLYLFLSPFASAALHDIGGAMKDPVLRFWAVEHVLRHAHRRGARPRRAGAGAAHRLPAPPPRRRHLLWTRPDRDPRVDSVARFGACTSAPALVERGPAARLFTRDPNPSIGGADAKRRTAAADVGADRTAGSLLRRHRVVDVDAAVHGSGLEVRRVVLRNPQSHSAIRRLHVEPAALPRAAVKIDVDAAIARATLDLARHPRQPDAAVHGRKFHVAIDAVDA